MSPEVQFYIQLAGCFVAAGVIFYLMQRHADKQQAAREQQFQLTMAAIEARNKIHPMYKKDE
jgi:hypothetical protein